MVNRITLDEQSIKEVDEEDTSSLSSVDDCYVALFKQSTQISQDYWDVTTATKLCSRETTIGEIADWFLEHYPKAMKIHVEISQAV